MEKCVVLKRLEWRVHVLWGEVRKKRLGAWVTARWIEKELAVCVASNRHLYQMLELGAAGCWSFSLKLYHHGFMTNMTVNLTTTSLFPLLLSYSPFSSSFSSSSLSPSLFSFSLPFPLLPLSLRWVGCQQRIEDPTVPRVEPHLTLPSLLLSLLHSIG